MFVTSRLLPQAKYWSVHVCFCAAPSFIIAYIYEVNAPTAIAAMLSGVATFIVAYTLITSTTFYTEQRENLLGKAVRAGTNVRLIISFLSLLALLINRVILKKDSTESEIPEIYQFLPDFWCGYASTLMVYNVSNFTDSLFANDPFSNPNPLSSYGFIFIFLVTIVEGILLSLVLLIIIFFAFSIINIRQRNKHYRTMHLEDNK